MSIRSSLAAVAAILVSVNAHITMKSPVPYSVEKLDNGPISAAQFPCKAQNGFTVSTMNKMAVGQQQTIKFDGTAVHGGGSCQLSVTMDTTPTKDSVFKVIKSIEGGCPGTEGTTTDYNFELPDSIPNGKATFAWTWFSKMSGAPELYMNCAPIEVTGGASDNSAFNALPDMLVANIGGDCKSQENFAIKFPNPGSVVEQGAANDQKPPTGSCGSSSGGSTPASPSSPAAQPSSAPGSPAAGQPSPVAGEYPAQSSASTGPLAPSTTATPGTASPAAPGAGSPSAPGAGSPSAPGAGSPALPSTGSPSAPGAGSPSAPGSGSPSAPGAGSPSAPGTSSPASPGTSSPASPGTSSPVAPGTGSPIAPGTGAPASSPAPLSPSAPSPATSGGSSTSTCTTPGAIVCNGAKQFGLCNNGSVVWQPVAAGSTCANGAITKRSFNSRITRGRTIN